MDGFVDLVRDILIASGAPPSVLYKKKKVALPGWFRPEKRWDLLVVLGEKPNADLVACIEFKSHVGPSFGNNYNNRTEEALGSAADLRAAYREGAFRPSPKPFAGYFMLVEEAEGSTVPVGAGEPHFPVFPDFAGASYIRRYEILTTKLVREGLYDAACLLASGRQAGIKGEYREVSAELSFRNLVATLLARVHAALATRRTNNGC